MRSLSFFEEYFVTHAVKTPLAPLNPQPRCFINLPFKNNKWSLIIKPFFLKDADTKEVSLKILLNTEDN